MSAPQLIFLAGPNGAGKSTFFRTYLRELGLYFVNADEIAQKTGISNEEAAKAADALRSELIQRQVSFVTETVFSDPVGAKLAFLRQAIAAGYHVRLIFIGLASVSLSDARVCMRVTEGGHDVPPDRLKRRYEQSLKNLKASLAFVPEIHVYDNSSSQDPFRVLFVTKNGKIEFTADPLPPWLRAIVKTRRLKIDSDDLPPHHNPSK
jgi:predicted ABC-type ATPase